MDRDPRESESDLLSPLRTLQNFIDEYEDHGDFEKARGARGTARYEALRQVRSYYDESVRSQIIKLLDAWNAPDIPDIPDVSDEEDFENYLVAQMNENLRLQ
jgi:hypothetical protein